MAKIVYNLTGVERYTLWIATTPEVMIDRALYDEINSILRQRGVNSKQRVVQANDLKILLRSCLSAFDQVFRLLNVRLGITASAFQANFWVSFVDNDRLVGRINCKGEIVLYPPYGGPTLEECRKSGSIPR